MIFTDQQRAVIEHDRGPALVLAGAGCAKTTTLCARAGRLVERGVAPNLILVTTFARLGAADTARRLARLGVSPDVRTATLHSLAFQAILESPTDRRPVVPHDWMVLEVVQKALRQLAGEEGRLEAGRVREGSYPSVPTILAELALAKANLIWPDPWAHVLGTTAGYREWATSRRRDALEADAARAVEFVYRAVETAAFAPEKVGYEPVEAGHDRGDRWVTFDDMLALVGRGILREEGWLRDWKGRFAYVLLDETQDNNLAQWTFCEHLARDGNLMAVGDDQQSIFAFRGARPELMREFLELHPDAAVLPLSVNFRSGQRILDVANGLLAHATDRLYEGRLSCGRGSVGAVIELACENGDVEASSVVEGIAQEIERGRSPDEIAVLYRLNAQKGPIELELIRRGIPYRAPDTSYFRRDEVRAAVGYLACALDPNDVEGWRRCANVPTRYLGSRFFEAVPTLSIAREHVATARLGRFKVGASLAMRSVDEVRARLDGAGLEEALRYILDDIPGDPKMERGLRRVFRARGAGPETTTDTDRACDTLLECAVRFVQEAGGSARAGTAKLVSYAREQAAATGRVEPDGVRDDVRRVSLSTIHKAKGLEWESVYAVGWNAGLLPLRGASLPEERRLAYVCATRARDLLTISFRHRQESEFVGHAREGVLTAAR